ncbi:hypothetical protein SAMN05421799_10625 [Alicyclobacillus vulcanalis]|uniref:PA14 domain-containing protein n=1 Tax=Alicyclobacillus vulcanalis TaxID=252246 RepID=A0A1N7MQ39_9BACL|nr:hypothetical protein SAMN05421799_10625 [Alicyclobacillus vulcanalis]
MPLHDSVFYQIMQSTLNRAYPSGLPSNQVLTQFAMPYDNMNLQDVIEATLVQAGYPYGWGEYVATNGPGTYSLTEPYGLCWLLRLDAQKPINTSVSLSVAVGSGSMTPITRLDPAQTLVYAPDLFSWSKTVPLGRVQSGVMTVPSRWPDPNAVWMGPVANANVSAPVGEWLLQKWVWFPSNGTYTVYLAGDSVANLFIDGAPVVQYATVTMPGSGTAYLNEGWHLVSISCINQGATPSPTGVVLSIQDSSGTIIENGSYHPVVGTQWQTSGYINPVWTTVTTEDDMRYSWWVIPGSQITSQNVQLQVSVTSNSSGQSPQVNGIWWYTVAPWNWDYGGQYDLTSMAPAPATSAPVQLSEVVVR